ncbi:Sodium-dependent phosphate transporter [Candidatus Hydrogenisulfobacillus filiaventi]|uniref:Sodium-dependent phosphate transporter n=1 Tax=Candidatus Hydrogenisulfobacillus filiaventi TaxID=2707344 RepID=A0A6F8ZK37_9FIRM|nr:Sodium-dependent phosphate transporter [Candidatus Hydrogenisulfobacillus filiaventi]
MTGGLLLELLAGLALFSFGLTETADGVGRLAGGWLRTLVLRLGRTPWGAVALGTLTTVLAGSSSAITVMAVGFTSAGVLTLARTLDVMLGAAIGTTLTVQLVSFDWIRYAPLLLLAGMVLHFAERGRRQPGAARLVLGFGLLFYGMLEMIGAVHGLAGSAAFRRGLAAMAAAPAAAFLAGLAVTALIQNSATVIALAVTFSLHHLLPLDSGLLVVLGANVGSTAAVTYSAFLGGPAAARRAAMAYVFMKAGGAALAVLALPWFARLDLALSPAPGRVLADAHTLFNLLNALLFLPWTGRLAAAVNRLVPDRTQRPVAPLLDPRYLDDPREALERARREVERMARLIGQDILPPWLGYLHQPAEGTARALHQAEADVDLLHHAVAVFLIAMAHRRAGLAESERLEQIRLLYLANHLEHLADGLLKAAATRAKLAQRGFWSPDVDRGMGEIAEDIRRQYGRFLEALTTRDPGVAAALVQALPGILRKETEVRLYILTRLAEQEGVPAIGTVLELSDDLAVIGQRLATLGRVLLGIY